MSAPFIVCAWHTPDYRCWADKLIASLDAIGGIPHDIVEVPKLPGSWEANTMAKPGQLLAAMDRHPNEVIVFLDVDCEVLGDLSPLAGITGDVAFYIRTKYRRGGRHAVRRQVRDGRCPADTGSTAAMWRRGPMQVEMPHGAMSTRRRRWSPWAARPGAAFTVLPVECCATEGDSVPAPVILHDSASRGVRKITRTHRRLRRIWQVLRG